MENDNLNNYISHWNSEDVRKEWSFIYVQKQNKSISAFAQNDQGKWTKNLIEMGAINPETVVQTLVTGSLELYSPNDK